MPQVPAPLLNDRRQPGDAAGRAAVVRRSASGVAAAGQSVPFPDTAAVGFPPDDGRPAAPASAHTALTRHQSSAGATHRKSASAEAANHTPAYRAAQQVHVNDMPRYLISYCISIIIVDVFSGFVQAIKRGENLDKVRTIYESAQRTFVRSRKLIDMTLPKLESEE